MKHTRLPVLCLLVLLALAACGRGVAEVAPTAPPPTATAVPTAAPTATPMPTATPAPTATPRPTPTPKPTEVACDLDRLAEAVDNQTRLTSYRQEATAYGQFAGQQLRQRLLTISGSVAMADGQVSAMDMRLASYTDAGQAMHIIMVADQFYFSEAGGPWQLAPAAVAAMLAAEIGPARAADDTLLVILEDRPCEPFSETIDGRVTEGLRFSDITFEDLAALPSAAGDLSQLPADMKQSGEYTLWLAEVDGLLLSVRTRLTLTFDVGDGVSVIEAVTAMSDFNKPLTITAPADIATPTFALDLARPDDAVVIVEDSLVLVFLTQEPPEEIKTFYTQALTAEGWTLDENRKSSISGSNADLLSFSRGEERMEVAISVSDDGETVVSFILIPAE